MLPTGYLQAISYGIAFKFFPLITKRRLVTRRKLNLGHRNNYRAPNLGQRRTRLVSVDGARLTFAFPIKFGMQKVLRHEGYMHYLLIYEVVPDYAERRVPFRAMHLAHARAAHARGELILGGALADPIDGAVLLFSGDSPAAAEEFAKNDPYVKNGLVTKWTVRTWTTVVGDQAAVQLSI